MKERITLPNLIVIVALISIIFAASSGYAAEPAAERVWRSHGFWYERPVVERLEPEQFPILPWGWTPGDAKALAEIKDCGFNLAGFVAPEHIELVEQAGLKAIINDPRMSQKVNDLEISDAEIESRVASVVAPFRGNKTVYGYYLWDEPTAHLFPALARWSAAIAKVDTDVQSYINLFPVGPPDFLNLLGGFSTYEEYVEAYVEQVKPRFISYDNYSLMDDGSLRPQYFENLEAIRKVSQRHGLPFWNIILGNSHFHYASPTPGGLHFQVYTTLAYGGRGISYFTYFSPLIGNFREAAVDQFLNKTPTWDIIRNVNLQIHRLGPTYLKLKNINVFHHPDVPEGCLGIDSSKLLSVVEGGRFVVGEFQDPDGRPFVMVVNKDYKRSTPLNIRFKEEGRIMFTSAYTGEDRPWVGENNWLGPGQGMLMTLSK